MKKSEIKKQNELLIEAEKKFKSKFDKKKFDKAKKKLKI